MKRMLALLTLILVTTMTVGCAGRAERKAARYAALPVAKTVCLQLNGVKEPENAIIYRRASEYLVGYGFQMVEADCDVHINYVALDAMKWEVLERGLFGKQYTLYRSEGMLTIRDRTGQVAAQDISVYVTKQYSVTDLMTSLAWQTIKPITYMYRPE